MQEQRLLWGCPARRRNLARESPGPEISYLYKNVSRKGLLWESPARCRNLAREAPGPEMADRICNGKASSGKAWPDGEIWPERRPARKWAIRKRMCKGNGSSGKARPDGDIWPERRLAQKWAICDRRCKRKAPLEKPGREEEREKQKLRKTLGKLLLPTRNL